VFKSFVIALVLCVFYLGGSPAKSEPVKNEFEKTVAKVPVQGKVIDRDGLGLARVEVIVRDSQWQTITDGNGRFLLELPPGQYTLDVEGGDDLHFHQVIDVTREEQSELIVQLQDEPGHKLVIRANPLEHTSLDMATPTTLISGEELVMKRAGTLGDILQNEPGLSVSSFGPAVARPVIRGLSGSRVTITNNQMMVQDASTISPDHDVGIEALLIEQVEVVKGPATLLYGSGSIGGVVNAIDRKISGSPNDGLSGGIELRGGDSATGEKSAIFSLDGGQNNWNWHLDGYTNQSDELQIPSPAMSQALYRQISEQDGELPANADVAENDGKQNKLNNSQVKTSGGSVGATRLTEWGHWGFAVSRVDKNYGVPGADETSLPVDENSEEEAVAIEMVQTRYDLQAKIEQPFEAAEELFVGYASTDYNLQELEGLVLGTEFINKAWEFKSYLKQSSWKGWDGIVGYQQTERDFAAIGEEAFVPPSTTKNKAIFIVEEKQNGDLKWELGARFENQQVSAVGQNSIDGNATSFSAGAVYSLARHNKLALNFARAVRFATAEELFSEGPHIATRSYEIGNEALNNEISSNFDFSYRFERAGFNGEVNFYVNRFSDFIYGANASSTDACVTVDAALEAQSESLQLVCYKQQDAKFKGVELAIETLIFEKNLHQLKLELMADYTRAELDDGENVPRIPPAKTGVSLRYDFDQFSSDLSWVRFRTQNDVALNELPTEGFDMLDLDLIYRLPFQANEMMLFLKGKNLLDEEARDHASFLKDFAPRAGRSFILGARYSF